MNYLGQASTVASVGNPNWSQIVTDIITFINKKNYGAANSSIQNMLTQVQTQNIVPLQPEVTIVANLITKAASNPTTLANPTQINQELSKLKVLAKLETDTGPEDRIQNENMINFHISNLQTSINNLSSIPSFASNVWDKLTGTNQLAPLYQQQTHIKTEIDTLPLTTEGRQRANNYLQSIQIMEPNLWTIFGSGTLLIFGLYLGKALMADILVGHIKKHVKLLGPAARHHRRKKHH